MGSEPYSEEQEEKEDKEGGSDSSEGVTEVPASKGLDAIKYYLKEIRKTPLLTFEQNRNSPRRSKRATRKPAPK